MQDPLEWLEKPTTTVERTGQLFGISRGAAYNEARTGSIAGVPVLRIGRRMVVPTAPLRRALGIEA